MSATHSTPADSVTKLSVDQTIKLDELGPMIVNSDGTLSRISNWGDMSEAEKQRSLRLIGARNKIRMENEAKKLENNNN